jgi:hypothetical protein
LSEERFRKPAQLRKPVLKSDYGAKEEEEEEEEMEEQLVEMEKLKRRREIKEELVRKRIMWRRL